MKHFRIAARCPDRAKAPDRCCRFVTVQTIRNCLVSPDVKLGRFTAAVHELSEVKAFAVRALFALRQIVAESA
jgi:hypothetical protein